MIQYPFGNAGLGVTSRQGIAIAAETPTNPSDVRIGAEVRAVYVEMWVAAESTAMATSIAIIEKSNASKVKATPAEMIALDDYPNKKNILWTHQGLTSSNATNATPIIQQWIKIPKGKQRMGQGDRIDISLLAVVDGFNFCGQAIFKEYF